MDNTHDEKIPRVFVSYSHDSSSHKKWVGELSSKLVKNGIDVILDQWDLGLGDDVPKFMESSVRVADRVLMICTEPYVKKADEGKGGVGYEAMIVTGQLIQDLGTSKFIPVVRQKASQPSLPKAVSTRFFINLSKDQNFEKQFEILLRELHQVPTENKPPLGKNPFAVKPSGAETPQEQAISIEIPDLAELSHDIPVVYDKALEVARMGDLVVWRRMVRKAVSPISAQLNEWRNKHEKNMPNDIKLLHEIALEGANIYSAIFSIALAGVESGREKFANQISLIDEILNPKGWNPAGIATIVDFPDTLACIYQALHGAMCLQTHQLSLSTKFARAKVSKRFEEQSIPLNQHHEIVGWPVTLGRKSNEGWSFLTSLPEKWDWLKELYGTAEKFKELLCAYYLVLNIIEFVDIIAAGEEDILQQKELRLDIPLCFLHEDYEILWRSYRLALVDPLQVREIWESKNISESKLKDLWPIWINHLKYWLGRVYDFGGRTLIIHKNLFDDIA